MSDSPLGVDYDYAVVDSGEVQARLWSYDRALSWLEAHYPNAEPVAPDTFRAQGGAIVSIEY